MSEAMLPPAPGLFSITTDWPHTSCRRLPISRAVMSVEPPGGNGHHDAHRSLRPVRRRRLRADDNGWCGHGRGGEPRQNDGDSASAHSLQ